MKLKRLKKLILLLTGIGVLSSPVVLGATQVTRSCNVNYTYEWGDGIYGTEANKNLWRNGEQNTKTKEIVYQEDSLGAYPLEPSVGYAYYMAKSYGLNNADMQSVIYMSDRWGNATNMKDNKSQKTIGTGSLYERASQYGTTYYGVLKDAIKNKKNALRLKDTEATKNNLKVLVDQQSGTYTVGPYKLELNVTSNKYTKKGAEYLYNELNRTGNQGYTSENAFARTNEITGMNAKVGTNPIFVDENGKQITFPDFIPGQEKNFYIRFVPANDGAIVETGNPIINISYLTTFVAKEAIKGTPIKLQGIMKNNSGNLMAVGAAMRKVGDGNALSLDLDGYYQHLYSSYEQNSLYTFRRTNDGFTVSTDRKNKI